MNAFNFTDAVRDDTSLLIGIAGASGSGKTMSALRMATGLAQGDPIYFIDTEAKRGLHYAQDFKFKHLDMRPPFTPEAFAGAISTAEQAGAKVIIIDSMSDEYEGMGGLQEMHDDEVARLARKPFDQLQGWEIDKFNAPAWKVPKTRHKTKLISYLRQVRAYVIFCLRAEEKIKFVKVMDEKTGREKNAIESAGWTPICEKRFMYDLTLSFTVTPDAPGIPLIRNGEAVYGKMQKQHLSFFPENKQVTELAGQQLRAWARGENTNVAASTPSSQAQRQDAGADLNQSPASPEFIRILNAYHADLAGANTAQDIAARHQSQRETLLTMPEALVSVAQQILRAHNDRAHGRADAETVAVHVQSIIDGVA